jgi:uncharacterized protein YdbL (DUF1318 family)
MDGPMIDRRTAIRGLVGKGLVGLAVSGALVSLTSGPAFALSLDEARASGFVGEGRNGYVAVMAGAPGEVRQLVDQVNAARRQQYQAIASGNGTNLATVEALAGRQLIERAGPGTFVEATPGGWVRK